MKDPYVDENGVLKNKLAIKDHIELKMAEADIGFLKLTTVDAVDVRFFDENLVKTIHRHIFQDIFDWAGEYRTIQLVKEEIVLPKYSIPYCQPKEIDKELKRKINELNKVAWQNMSTEEIATKFAREMALIWKVHPFRDGNTRTMLSFAYLYAKEHGFPLDIVTFARNLNREISPEGKIERYSIRDKFVLACLDEKDYPEVEPLAAIFETAIKNYSNESHKTKK